MENRIEAPEITKTELCDSAIPLLGIHQKECESGCNKGTCIPMFIPALFTISKLWKQPRCLNTDEWIKKI
jgi:hypothetical protein